MKQDPYKRPVIIVDAKTGKSRLSEPMPVHSPHQVADETPAEPVLSVSPPEVTQGAAETPLPVALASDASPPEAQSPAGTQDSSSEPTAPGDGSPNGAPAKKAPKAEIETLEAFIAYAYGRKGKPLKLTPKVEKQIAQNPRLDDAALSRLLQVVKGDVLLAVPRQLLLLSRDIDGLPALRDALSSFVSDVMRRHPAFQDAGVQAALRNVPNSLSPASALAKVMAFAPAADEEAEPLKGDEPATLRHNAAQLFVTWLAVNRGLNAEELSSLLFQVIWSPAARELPDDNARLRALTDLAQAAGVGLACQRFQQRAIDAQAQQAHAQREAADLREKLAATQAQLASTEEQRDALQAKLQALQERFASELDALRQQQAVERTHLQHELAQLQGRLVKRLTASVEMLEVGLSALRKDPPSVRVMVERAEDVVDALQAEMQQMREE